MPIKQTHERLKLDADQRADLLRRAKAAWFSAGGRETPNEPSGIKVRQGLVYLELHGTRRVLAVCRVRPDNFAPRAMKRWPESVER